MSETGGEQRARHLARTAWLWTAVLVVGVVALLLTSDPGRTRTAMVASLILSAIVAALLAAIDHGLAQRPGRTDLAGPLDLSLVLLVLTVVVGLLVIGTDPAPPASWITAASLVALVLDLAVLAAIGWGSRRLAR